MVGTLCTPLQGMGFILIGGTDSYATWFAKKKVCAGAGGGGGGKHPLAVSSESPISLSSPRGKNRDVEMSHQQFMGGLAMFFLHCPTPRVPGCGAVQFTCPRLPCGGLAGGCPWAGALLRPSVSSGWCGGAGGPHGHHSAQTWQMSRAATAWVVGTHFCFFKAFGLR